MANRTERRRAMNRAELTDKIADIKRRKGLAWQAIAAAMGPGSALYYTAALQGQMSLSSAEAAAAGRMLGLAEDEVLLLQETPYRGSLPTAIPTDPLIYRFYEIMQVYGSTLKALIQEEFGDGIMSAIDFDLALERQSDPKGDRVRVIMSGKFLPYKHF
jgi:cyanate lyase